MGLQICDAGKDELRTIKDKLTGAVFLPSPERTCLAVVYGDIFPDVETNEASYRPGAASIVLIDQQGKLWGDATMIRFPQPPKK